MAKRILIVASELSTARFVSLELKKEDFIVDIAEKGETAFSFIETYDYDLYLLDFKLVDMSSDEFASRLGKIKPASVIIVVVSTEDACIHEEAIRRFAVTYIVKPFVMTDLTSLVKSIFRGRDFIDQHCKQTKLPMMYHDLRIDTKNHLVYRADELIELTRREYDLLATLMQENKTLTREQLLERVWKYEASDSTNVVDVYIRYLRGKIDVKGQPSYIKTVRGVGYAMRD